MNVSEVIGGIGELKSNNGTQYFQQDRVYNVADIAQCIPSQLPGGGYKIMDIKKALYTHTHTHTDAIFVRQATKDGAIECKIGGVADLNYVGSTTRRGRVQGNGEICPTLTTENIPSVLEPWIWEIDGVKYLIRIRKLTPRECWRLMDFNEGAFDQAEKVNSNTQLYKQAGNSIVVNCLTAIIGQMLEGKEDVYKQI